MTKAIRKLPQQYPPVTTGGVQFGKEKPGVYFTGESAAYCAGVLKKAVPYCPDSSGLLSSELQSIADTFWESKINLARSVSLHGELTKQVLEEVVSLVKSVNDYAVTNPALRTPKEALKFQSEKIIAVLRQLQADA